MLKSFGVDDAFRVADPIFFRHTFIKIKSLLFFVMEITENKVVKMQYKGTLEDGKVFDTSEGRKPLEFIFGIGMIIPGLEEGIKGLKQGDKKEVNVPSDKAYGPVQEDAKQEVPRSQLPPEIEPTQGMQLAAQGPQGVIPVTIVEVKDETVVVDFNHPLAGKDLTFNVEILEVRDATKEELEHKHVHDENGEHPSHN